MDSNFQEFLMFLDEFIELKLEPESFSLILLYPKFRQEAESFIMDNSENLERLFKDICPYRLSCIIFEKENGCVKMLKGFSLQRDPLQRGRVQYQKMLNLFIDYAVPEELASDSFRLWKLLRE